MIPSNFGFRLARETWGKSFRGTKFAKSENDRGVRYLKGPDAVKNQKKALKCFSAAAVEGFIPAIFNLGRCYLNGTGVKKDEAKGINYYLKAAHAGYAPAQHGLGYYYSNHKKDKLGIHYYTLAAKQKFIISICNLGDCYNEGTGVKQNLKKAALLYKIGASLGESICMNNLGWLYQNGYGVKKDLKKAVVLYKRSIAMKCSGAYESLGYLYAHGVGVKQDIAKAKMLFKQSIALDKDAYSQADLGLLYENEWRKDEAVSLYKLSAAQGNGLGQYLLANHYSKNKNELAKSQKYYKLAVASFEKDIKAYDANDTEMFYLAQCYEHGLGVARNPKKARYYYEMAVAHGYRDGAVAIEDLAA